MKYRSQLIVLILLSCAFSAPVLAQQNQALHAPVPSENSAFERKSISFFFNQATPLNDKLVNDLKVAFPRANYITQQTHLGVPLETVIQNLRSQSETLLTPEQKAFLNSDYILVPQWSYEPVQLVGPYRSEVPKPEPGQKIIIHTDLDWGLNATSQLKLTLGMYNPRVEKQGYEERFMLSQELLKKRVAKVNFLSVQGAINVLNVTRRASLGGIDKDRLLTQKQRVGLFQELLKKNKQVQNAVKHFKAQDPQILFAEEIADASFGEKLQEVFMKQDDFKVRARLKKSPSDAPYVRILLPQNETRQSLGIKPDMGYVIIDKKIKDGVPTPEEVAYLRVREIQEQSLLAEPIYFNRPLQTGDQVIELNESALGVAFRLGGTASLFPATYGGNLGADLRLKAAKFGGPSEVYGIASFDFLGTGLDNSFGSTFEFGAEKRWYAAPFSFGTGLKAGLFRPWRTPRDQNQNAFVGLGGTAYVGANWHQSSEASYGLQAGWKQYFYDADGTFSVLIGGPFLEGVMFFK